MTVKVKDEDQLGSSFWGWVRFGGFVGLVLTLVPTFLVLRTVSSSQAAKVPMLFQKGLSRLLGMKVRVHGKVAGGLADVPVLYVCNHSSYLDIPVLG
ncbi:MAG: hypothetical protein AB7E52_03810, partial [Bdellovibrionales bacterium]